MVVPPLRVTILNWRDTTHPEGGGSERYVEKIAADLVADGCRVEVWCARHRGSPARNERDGVTFRRVGGRLTVYPRALAGLAWARLNGRSPDVVVDVQNGVPFFARLVAGVPVVVLVHHVHREQWHVVFGRMLAGLGWWMESRAAPRVNRGCQYIAVSEVTRRELIGLGVRGGDIAVVHNGNSPIPETSMRRDPDPSLVVLGRLVPHKRVEVALEVLARLAPHLPGLRQRVIGDGWWRGRMEREATLLAIRDKVTFTGHVDEETKQRLLAWSWVLLAPSVKEGWGLMVTEAAAHGVPAVAFRGAGGLDESILNGRTGLLAATFDEFLAGAFALLTDQRLRVRLGEAARAHSTTYSWRTASRSVLQLLQRAASGMPPIDAVDPAAPEPVGASRQG